MAKLAYCRTCRATYPLNIVSGEGSRGGKSREPACPMGHADVQELDTPRRPRARK